MNSVLLAMILIPLAGSILNGWILRSPFPRRAGVIATVFALASLVCAIVLNVTMAMKQQPFAFAVPWFGAGNFGVPWAFRLDSLSGLMCILVTGIGSLVHVYSIGYMAHDATPSRYFAYLNLFVASMLILVCADNLPCMFVGWEGVGACSYLLVGYWFQDVEKVDAANKAFLVNRIGDAGFLAGSILCYQLFHSMQFSAITVQASALVPGAPEIANWAALLLFVGAMGKSAQIPLYVWLPDAMAGPTPVSALIHAATMVTAGIYMVVRLAPFFFAAQGASVVIAWIGLATALLAALIATSQRDIKKVLAYSTVSQLGLMVLGLGAGAYVASMFHLLTHAFFKALLFLGAGSVIHALNGEQDLARMGGLRKALPTTSTTFLIGTLAIAGVPPLAGFWSKDLLLYQVLGHPQYGAIWWIGGTLVSLLTAFYMFRLYWLVFGGTYRGSEHAHESPAVMTVPLGILAVGSIFAGVLELPEAFGHLGEGLTYWLAHSLTLPDVARPALPEIAAMGIAVGVAAVGIALGWLVSVRRGFKALSVVLEHHFWIDELYYWVFIVPFEWASGFLTRVIDRRVVVGIVLFPGKVCRVGGAVLGFLQVGSVQFYLMVMSIGALAVLWASLRAQAGW